MSARRIAATALSGVVLVAGCSSTSAPGDPRSRPTSAAEGLSASDEVVNAFKESYDRLFDAGSFSVVITTGPIQVQGWVDDRRDALKTTVFYNGRSSETVRIGDDLWMQEKLGSDTWYLVDVSRLDQSDPVLRSLDLGRFAGLLDGLVSATRGGDELGGPYKGVADLRLAAKNASAARRPGAERERDSARNAAAVPVRGVLDDAGRLKQLTYTLEVAEGQATATIMTDDLGEPVEIDPPPAGQVKKAPEGFYDQWG
ncbi:hypothetical protein Ais01nite_54350 [Asanoa ishikariensis]|uniref:Lipoprotein n=1 Tax=Asanoa ishikariensis TaxID=137265 RepID=A0A1H3TS43_9ACTN|nr:hypothetical protein [Asanoa ishikariensis]GIF67400.1 hypothetical protein Ais01nite_54350 [Asanoa ishikariensis]SDZ53074.1 hypothetical protein SAMN05421684_6296 [Asanoa ishikariensis]